MPLHILLSFAFLAVLGTLALPQIPRLWRHKTTFYDRVPTWCAWGGAAFRGWVRSMPLGASLAYLGILMAVYLGFISPKQHPLAHQVDLFVIGLFLVLFFGDFLLVCTIFLFNVPKLLVPAHLRGQPGYVEERLRQSHHRGNTRLDS